MSADYNHYSHNLLPHIEVLGESYEIPVMGKNRRIAVILPHDYKENPEKKYPVLYLQDGQNLYEESAPFGTWSVNKRMAYLAEKGMGDVIVVAIDHAEEYRIKEFSPFKHPELGDGEGEKYVDFIVERLKPHIDKNYRTLPKRQHTGIGGSSMGGLISLYAGLIRPDTFGKLMIFSPSLWISPKIYETARKFEPKEFTQVYMYAGGSESMQLLPNAQRIVDILQIYAKNNPKKLLVKLAINPSGTHSEYFWGQAFPEALPWLYFLGLSTEVDY